MVFALRCADLHTNPILLETQGLAGFITHLDCSRRNTHGLRLSLRRHRQQAEWKPSSALKKLLCLIETPQEHGALTRILADSDMTVQRERYHWNNDGKDELILAFYEHVLLLSLQFYCTYSKDGKGNHEDKKPLR